LAGNFPWSVIFGFIRGSKRHAKAEKTYNEYAGEEGCGFHGAVFYRHSRPGQTDFVVPACCSRRRAGDAMRRWITHQSGASHSEAATRNPLSRSYGAAGGEAAIRKISG